MSHEQQRSGRRGGRPAGYALPRWERGRREELVEPGDAGASVPGEEDLEVTLEEVRALRAGPGVIVQERVLAVLLRRWRLRCGWSQRELGRMGGVSRQEVGQLEAACHPAGYGVWCGLCMALGGEFWRWARVAETVARQGRQL